VGQFGGTCDFVKKGCDAPKMEKGYEKLRKSHPEIDYLGVCKLVPAHPTPVPTMSTRHSTGNLSHPPQPPLQQFPSILPLVLAVPLLLAGLLLLAVIKKIHA
jgi:hypothetical protein